MSSVCMPGWSDHRHGHTLIKKKIRFFYKEIRCKVIYDYRPPHIWGKICAFPHLLGSPSSYMTFSPDPIWISLHMRAILFSFLSVHRLEGACEKEETKENWKQEPIVLPQHQHHHPTGFPFQMINNDLWHCLLRTGGKKEVKGLHSNQSGKHWA